GAGLLADVRLRLLPRGRLLVPRAHDRVDVRASVDRAAAGRERARRGARLPRASPRRLEPRHRLGARSAMNDLVVHAVDVRKRFGKLEVLKGVSLDVRRGETVCIIGPSGSGKTTFIRCVNHLEKIDSGRIEVNGHLIGYRERKGKLV